MADIERGILDDSSTRVRPSREEREAMRAEAEALLATRCSPTAPPSEPAEQPA
jgi:hypothetical protein